ncbi:MAG: hypothetical protein KF861_15125 [Planctomycetaceae bacterium]|nr:hypothetical protein [Planctomycetaceae bacterium]
MQRLILIGSTVLLSVVHSAGSWQADAAGGESRHAVGTSVAEPPLDRDWVQVSGLLNRKCLACHLVGEYPIPFADHRALVNARTSDGELLIVPGQPQDSPLFQKTCWNFSGEPGSEFPDQPEMPADDEGEWLTPGQMELLARWICKGAPKFAGGGSVRPLSEVDFPSAHQCKGCHPKQFDEWSRSPHAYAQKSPVFEAFTLTMLERTSGTVGTFCTRCHTPQGVALGETGLTRNRHRSRLAMEGITCVVCHRRSHKHGRVNVQFFIQPGELMTTCQYGPFDDPVYTEQERHPAEGQAFIRTSMFCGSCHDVTNPEGLRLEEAFSEYRNGPAAAKGITCQECHMGPIPGVPVKPDDRPCGYAAVVPNADPSQLRLRPLTNHSFCGPDYSLLPDTEYPHKLDWMYEFDYRDESVLNDYQRRTLQALREKNHELLAIATVDRYRLLRNAARVHAAAPSHVACGSKVTVDVAVESIFEGHNFPTGFTEERQVWVQVFVYDAAGRVLFASGDLDTNNDLRYVHSYDVSTGLLERDRSLMHFQSLFLLQTDRGTERAVVIPVQRDQQQVNLMRPSTTIAGARGRPGTMRIQKSNLPPLATRERGYHFVAPDRPQTCTYRVRLLYRHLPPHLLDKVGVPQLKPLLEIVTIDEKVGTIEVGSVVRLTGSGP